MKIFFFLADENKIDENKIDEKEDKDETFNLEIIASKVVKGIKVQCIRYLTWNELCEQYLCIYLLASEKLLKVMGAKNKP